MPTTPSRPISKTCERCQGLTATDILRDDVSGLMCQVERCQNCGHYGPWGPARELGWPL